MIAKINLSNMRFYANHGCYATEQTVGTRFTVSLRATYNATQAAQSDQISHAVSYLDLYQCVEEQMMIPSHILEAVADRILNAVGQKFAALLAAEITIAKIAPPLGGDIEQVSVTMARDFR
ncbi:MAG: dihydroneopterin aldolase [Mucinivorans sp.]